MILNATKDMLQAIEELDKKDLNSGWTQFDYSKYINSPHSNFFCYLEDENVIGFILGSIVPDNCEILQFCVSKDYRNRGIGKLLFKKILENFPHNQPVFLEVKEDNLVALNLYKSFGFIQINKRAGYYKDGRAAIVLRRN